MILASKNSLQTSRAAWRANCCFPRRASPGSDAHKEACRWQCEKLGCTSSPGMCDSRTGIPVRAGTRNWLSVTSSMPGSIAPPPVSTHPAPSASSTPPWRRLSFTKYISSRARGSRISAMVRSAQTLRLADWRSRSPPQLRHSRHHRVAILALQLFSLRHRHLQSDGEIVGEVCAADGHRRRVRHRAFKENHHVARVRADVEQADAQLALIGGERRTRPRRSTPAPPLKLQARRGWRR